MVDGLTGTKVRALCLEDREPWRALWDAYLAFYRAPLPESLSDLTFTRLCRQQNGMLGLAVVDVDDLPIGFAHLVFHASTWSEHGYCYLEDLFVEPAQRGSGVAELLFAAADHQALERGIRRVYWHTQQFNGAARSLYDTVGRLTSDVVYERHPTRAGTVD